MEVVAGYIALGAFVDNFDNFDYIEPADFAADNFGWVTAEQAAPVFAELAEIDLVEDCLAAAVD